MVPFVCLSECFRAIVRLSVLVSATTVTCCYLDMYAVDGILGSASMRLVYSSTLGRQACAVQNTGNCTECAVIAACSVRTGHVFFGSLVIVDFGRHDDGSSSEYKRLPLVLTKCLLQIRV